MDSPFSHWYDNQTVVHPVGLAALIILSVALIALPRRFAFLPVLVLASLIPSAQRVVLGGLDFTFIRLLVLAGFVRILSRSELRGFRWQPLDRAVIACVVVTGIGYVARLRTTSALILQLGLTLDLIGMYLLSRLLVRNWRDLDRLALGATLLALPTAIFFMVEASTGRNLFAFFGGVPAITTIREGRLRCSGAFGNAILAGCFWASLTPLIVARGLQPGASRLLAALGTAGALVVVATCASSTPIMGILFALLASPLYLIRFELRWVRRGIVALLVSLHIVMKAPVWHLISRIDLVGGSTGYHRYNLIDKFIKNFGEWWLYGTNSTRHWAWGLEDVANEYVAYGVRGGLAALILLITVLTIAFRQNGRTLRHFRKDRARSIYAWSLGIALLMHTVMFFAVFYFGQTEVMFFATLGVIGSLTPLAARVRAPRATPAFPSPAPVSTAASPGSGGATRPLKAPSLGAGLLGRRGPRS
jgi:hypothetical protein